MPKYRQSPSRERAANQDEQPPLPLNVREQRVFADLYVSFEMKEPLLLYKQGVIIRAEAAVPAQRALLGAQDVGAGKQQIREATCGP